MKHNSSIEKSYFSLAQFPPVFEAQLSKHLESLEISSGRKVHNISTDIHRVLGAQGVGLSSLIAIGGSQVSGALGFYSTLKLFNETEEGNGDRFVIPTDVCNEFLESLAGEKDRGRTSKRSDLLLIELSDDSIDLVAIEIKFYGVGQPRRMAAYTTSGVPHLKSNRTSCSYHSSPSKN